MALASPWLKCIDFETGEATPEPLFNDAAFSLGLLTPEPLHRGWEAGFAPPAEPFEELVQFDGGSWFHVSKAGKRWLFHGSMMRTATGVAVFMEFPEARHAELEQALSSGPLAADVYADWLLEQGDPFGLALKPQVAKERGPAGLWWLEGFERTGALTTTLRDGFVREARLRSRDANELEHTLHRVCHLRACVALERFVIEPDVETVEDWRKLLARPWWTRCQWPRALRQLNFVAPSRPDDTAFHPFLQRMGTAFPQVTVTVSVD